MKEKSQKSFQYVLFWSAGILSVATIASFLAAFFDAFEMASHFPVQYGIGLAGFSCIFLLQKRFIIALVLSLCAFANGVLWYIPFSEVHARTVSSGSQGNETFLALLANVDHNNRDYGRLNALIQSSQPDFIVLLEVDSPWMEGLSALGSQYSNRVLWPDKTTGIAVVSREPILHSEVSSTEAGHPWITVGIQIKGKELILIGAHPPAPVSVGNWKMRNRQLEKLSQQASMYTQSVMVLGDLNITPWSPYYKKFLRQGGLIDWRSKFGWLPTWPAGIPLLWIPIDHVLTSPSVAIEEYFTGPDIGSDHYPIFVKGFLHLTPPPVKL